MAALSATHLNQDAGQAVVSLAGQAYLQLELALVTGELAAGQLLQEKVLAEQLGMGRTPVREAIQKLAGQGILRVLPRKGLMVAPLLRSDVLRVLETRKVLERLLVVKAAERASPSQRNEFRNLATQLATPDLNPRTYLEMDRSLDEQLAKAADNPFLAAALAPLHIHCRRLWFAHGEHLDLAVQADWHAGLAGAIADGDGAGAIRALNGIIGLLEKSLGDLVAIN